MKHHLYFSIPLLLLASCGLLNKDPAGFERQGRNVPAETDPSENSGGADLEKEPGEESPSESQDPSNPLPTLPSPSTEDLGVPDRTKPAPDIDAFGNPDPLSKDGDEIKKSVHLNLIWRRHRAFESSITSALELSREELCQELDQYNCVNNVHLTLLGGHEPFDKGQYRPLDQPSLLTPISIDRIVMQACLKRIKIDQSGVPTVFKGYPLDSSLPSEIHKRDLTQGLYRRLLARDPIKEEIDAVLKFTQDLDGITTAKLTCFAIGSSIEIVYN